MNATPADLKCARCFVPITEDGAFWTADGQVCGACEQREVLAAAFLKVYKSSGFGSLGAGVVSLLFNPFFAFTIASISSAVWTFKAMGSQDPQELEIVRNHRGPMVAAVIGVVLASVRIVAAVFDFGSLL